MEEVKLKGLHRVRTSDPKGNVVDAVLEIRYRRIKVLPPIGKQSRYRALSLTVIHASERDTPANRQPIEWKLITDLPVASRREAIEKLDWYNVRMSSSIDRHWTPLLEYFTNQTKEFLERLPRRSAAAAVPIPMIDESQFWKRIVGSDDDSDDDARWPNKRASP